MSYAADMKGLDLFTMPFRNVQASMVVPASGQGTARSTPISGKSKSRMQMKSTASRSKTPVYLSQPSDPSIEQVENSDIPEKSVPEQAKDAEPVQEQKPQAKAPEPEQKQPSEEKPGSPPKELVMDMSDHSIPAGKPLDASEDTKRKAHEEAEAKRKAEWEARQREKKEKEEATLQKLQAMTDADAVAASTECIRLAIERITRRNMKECVAGHIQSVCQKDPAFARCVMHPKKSLANCFKYINRQAKDYLKNEMEENGLGANGVYGGDVPDETCYQWGENYFRDPDAPEDIEREDKFVPRPYVSQRSSKAKKPKDTNKKKIQKKAGDDTGYQQMSLMEAIK